jgi:TolA-binding protein
LAKIHLLDDKIGCVGHHQNHPVNRLGERINFIGEASDHIGSVVDELNNRIDAQEVQIEQLANMVNDLVGKTEGQAKEIKSLKNNQEEHHKVINMLTAKVIALEQCVEDVSGPLCAQTPPEGIVLSKDVDISRVGCPSQTLCNEGTLAV